MHKQNPFIIFIRLSQTIKPQKLYINYYKLQISVKRNYNRTTINSLYKEMQDQFQPEHNKKSIDPEEYRSGQPWPYKPERYDF